MITIDNLDTWIQDYFSRQENKEKARKACERHDRLMVKNIRRQMAAGVEELDLAAIAEEDPGKRLEKVKYEILPSVAMDGKKGKLRINLLDQTAEFVPAEK